MRYDDFVLHIGGQRPGADGTAYALRVLQSPAGEGRGLFQPPVDRVATSALWARHRSAGLTDRSGSTETASSEPPPPPPPPGVQLLSPQEIGGRLFDAVFREQVGGLYDRSLGSLHGAEDQGLRLKIRLDQEAMGQDELGELPWELLYRRETGNFLALDRRSSIVRYLDVPQPSKPIPLPATLRVLVVTAEPRGELSPLDLDAEVDKLQQEADRVPNWDLEVVRGASVDGLRAACRRRGPFHIVHFMGHGGFDPASGEGVLYFQHPDGSPQPVTGRDLAAKLQDLESLGLVFLNACETAMSGGADPFSGVACSLVRGGLPAVVAMQRPISDRAAILFGSTFYAALASGLCGDEALVEARQAVHSDAPGSLEWTTPVLFARLREGTLFEPRPPEPEPEPSWRRWAALAGVALLSILATWVIAGLGGRTEVLTLDRVFATSQEGLDGVLRRVELLGDGTMRVFFEFTNGSADEQTLGFDWSGTYLADEHGNPYEVLRSSAPMDARELSATLPAGASQEVWIDVPAPRDGARLLGVALAPDEESDASYPYFEVELPDYPQRYGTRSEPPEPLAGATAVPIEARIPTSLDDLAAHVARVEMVPGEAMRWSLALLNRTSSKLDIDFDPERLVLVDDLGHVYRPRAYGIYGGQAFREYGLAVRRGLRADPWFEFPAPRAGARTFSLRLATRGSSGVTFGSAEVGLDTGRFALREPPWPESLLASPVAIPTTPRTVEARVLGIYRTPGGRMRWRLEWRNRGADDATVGLAYPRTRVVDGEDRYYPLRKAQPAAPVTSGGFTLRLIPGERREGWIDLDAPYADAGPLTLVPGNVGRAASSSPVTVGEIPWPGGGRTPPVEAPAPTTPSAPPPSLPEIESEPETEPPPRTVATFRLDAGEQEIGTTLAGLRVKMVSVDRLGNGRLRWNLELWNGGDDALDAGFHPETTKLYHGGHSYRLEQTSLGPRSSAPETRTLAPGESWALWLEFAGDFESGGSFLLVLGSPDPGRYRYRLLEARPSG